MIPVVIKIWDKATNEIRLWDDIPEEEQIEISKKLNRQCLSKLGYVEVEDDREDTKTG